MQELSDLQFAVLLTLPVVSFLVVIIAYPLGYSLWASFHHITFFGGFKATFIGVNNYVAAYNSMAFWHSVAVSLRFTFESVLFTMLVSLGIALVLARPSKGQGLIRSLVILPWAVSRYAAGIMFKNLWYGSTGIFTAISYLFGFNASVNVLNQKTVLEALAIGNAWNMAPLVTFFLLASIQTIPSRLYDLAELDHLGPFNKFVYVTLPYLRYTLFIFTAITTVLSLRIFDYIFVQTGGGPGLASTTLTYQIYKESFVNLHLGYGAAMSFYLLFLILSTTLLLYIVWGKKEE